MRGFTEGDRSYSVTGTLFQLDQFQGASSNAGQRAVASCQPPRHRTGPWPLTRRPAEPALDRHASPSRSPATRSRPQAHRLIEAVRELVEVSQGTVTVESAAGRPTSRAGVRGVAPRCACSPAPGRSCSTGRRCRSPGSSSTCCCSWPSGRAGSSPAPSCWPASGATTTPASAPSTSTSAGCALKLGGQLPLITTVYGVGYRLSDDAHVVIKPQRVAPPGRARPVVIEPGE